LRKQNLGRSDHARTVQPRLGHARPGRTTNEQEAFGSPGTLAGTEDQVAAGEYI
jgi:hypothetical protein